MSTSSTKDGVHLHSIGHAKEELKEPNGLCVHGQYMYVTDVAIYSHCVFVFTTEGEYVTSYGQDCEKEGDFEQPYCVYVDSNGFIYVTDFKCNYSVF